MPLRKCLPCHLEWAGGRSHCLLKFSLCPSETLMVAQMMSIGYRARMVLALGKLH